MKADPTGAGYIVQHRMGNYYRRGQYGRDEITERREAATRFSVYEAALGVASRVNGVVLRAELQLVLL